MAIQIRLAPINTGLYVDGESTSANRTFFEERARSGVDICMVGNIAVSERSVPNNSTGVMSSIARALIADPNHLVSARKKSTMLCDDCGECHFFSKGKRSVTCAKWHNKPNSAEVKSLTAD